MRKLIAAALFIFWTAAPVLAGFTTDDTGTSGAQFLKLGAGARAESMGEAFTAVVDDANAIYWNPAALSRIETHSATFMHAALLGDAHYEFLGYGQKIGRWGAIGAGVQYVSLPKIDQTDTAGFVSGNPFRPNDFAASFGYAYTVGEKMSLGGSNFGITVKYIQTTITKSASTFGVDLGYLSAPFRIWDREIRIAYVVQNLGGTLKFQRVADPLPLNLRLGSSAALTEDWTISFDVNEPLDHKAYISIGTEYRYVLNEETSFAGRFGLNSRSWGHITNLNGVSFGLGAKMGRFGIDYAFSPSGTLGLSQRVSLNFSF